MSTSIQTTGPSTSNFVAIFDAASREYKSLTKQDLATHPLAAAIEGYNSPDAILNIFRKQTSAFDKFCKGDDKLMGYLSPIVNILFTFSETLGEGVSLVSFHSLQYITVLYRFLRMHSHRRRRFSPESVCFSGYVHSHVT
jgi:hypothetical protein